MTLLSGLCTLGKKAKSKYILGILLQEANKFDKSSKISSEGGDDGNSHILSWMKY